MIPFPSELVSIDILIDDLLRDAEESGTEPNPRHLASLYRYKAILLDLVSQTLPDGKAA